MPQVGWSHTLGWDCSFAKSKITLCVYVSSFGSYSSARSLKVALQDAWYFELIRADHKGSWNIMIRTRYCSSLQTGDFMHLQYSLEDAWSIWSGSSRGEINCAGHKAAAIEKGKALLGMEVVIHLKQDQIKWAVMEELVTREEMLLTVLLEQWPDEQSGYWRDQSIIQM